MQEGDREFEGWAILELMGHRKLAGRCRWTQGPLLRIDVPGEQGDPDVASQFYAPGAIYCITPCAEDVARRYARGCRPEPVSRYELPALPRIVPGGDCPNCGFGDMQELADGGIGCMKCALMIPAHGRIEKS